ncbi:MAG: biopolymer transporter ExbD [Bacteroidetes bacterium]|nr:biopolymer transporter ExbD [Bacteroidota bacterium]MBL6962194.1 biopolymer transporter ExbD [Bacteroidota bacterium]
MKGKFDRKQGKKAPGISTASLPDIVFMLLFFFMVATVMRDSEALVKTNIPTASELTKLEKKEWVATINIGPPVGAYEALKGTAPILQLNDKFGTVEDVVVFVENERLQREPRIRPYISWALKIDKDVKMGIVTDVKQELRRANALKITYLAARGQGDFK